MTWPAYPMPTRVAPARLVPISVTSVPPAMLPKVGLIDVTVGADELVVYVYESYAVPPGVVSCTPTEGMP